MVKSIFYLILFTGVYASQSNAQFGIDRWQADESVKKGLNEQALAQYKQLLDQNVNDPELNFNAGNALYELKQYEPALQFYDRALQYATHPKMKSDIQYNMANCLFRMNQIEKSADLYKQVLKKSPNDQDAKFNYEYLLKLMQKKNQQQQKNDNQSKNQKQNEPKQNQSQQNKQDNNQQQNQQNKQQQDQQEQKQNKAKQNGMTKQAAERLLDMLKNQEQDYQRKNMKEKVAKEKKTDKDW
jgi:tetratricopeptide (TPR) repeat protein